VSRSRQREQSTVRYADETAASPQAALQLVVAYSPDAAAEGRELPLPRSPGQVTPVGREIEAPGLCVLDPRLSRLHFRIVWDQRSHIHQLGDANSANGTFVNGARVATRAIESGDVIRAGDTLFVVDEGDAMGAVERDLALVARSPNTVLLLGESGTGKEVLARFIHERSERPGSFIPVNCATIPKDLVAAELFGHTRGAFSGAANARPGLFMAAEEGTLFLDEVADLPLDVQPALLRALQEKRIRPVGAEREIACTARIVAATHVDLAVERAAGRFRQDLYARLSRFVFVLAPLRQRRREIMPLFRRFCRRPLELVPAAAEALLLGDYPGNIRELEGLVSAFEVLRPEENTFTLEFLKERSPHLAEVMNARSIPPAAVPRRIANTPRQLVALLNEHAWNITEVARALGCPRVQVYRWIKAYGLARPRADRE
jgi:DNA-binding NtrC family response regulator